QGTTSSRCIIYDRKGGIKSLAQKEFRQIYPKGGWVEHDAMEIWSSQLSVAQEAMAKINATHENIVSIGITNQRETAIVWEKDTGIPVYNAIVWQCRRTAEYCDELKTRGLTDKIREKTGLLPDAYFSATKLKWILDNVNGTRKNAEEGKLLFGTVETWLIWKLTGGKVHVTDYSNASRTMMFNINTLKWDNELLDIFEIPENMLPEPVKSSMVFGKTSSNIFGSEIPIAGAAGDQQSALFGQKCFNAGESKMTYGTGGFMLMNTGEKPVFSKNGLITTVAWGIGDTVHYALEGSVFVAGAAIQWLRDQLGLFDDSAVSEKMALSVPDSAGCYFVPAFVGLGAPYWDPYARGTILGITRGTDKNHIVRAALESMAFQTRDLADAMASDIQSTPTDLKADGGASANDFLMQFQADILDRDVIRPSCIETTSLGAAYLAGLCTGYWEDEKDIAGNCSADKRFKP
ncbi:MAG TPA: glycerol kinase GlpK, partial [Bacillota bacterium]|nr:glycerol kinase GlpK [Bacillota bacterium]